MSGEQSTPSNGKTIKRMNEPTTPDEKKFWEIVYRSLVAVTQAIKKYKLDAGR